MDIRELVQATRSYRRFIEDEQISREQLLAWVDLGRLSASGANRQPLRYILSCTPDMNAAIFPLLRWAAYLPHFGAPMPGERPSAYIVMLSENLLGAEAQTDSGIASQSIRLAAAAEGYGSCIFHNVSHQRLREALRIPETHDISMVIAFGRPAETVLLEELRSDSDIRYYRDEQDRHHVPKRPLASVVLDFLEPAAHNPDQTDETRPDSPAADSMPISRDREGG